MVARTSVVCRTRRGTRLACPPSLLVIIMAKFTKAKAKANPAKGTPKISSFFKRSSDRGTVSVATRKSSDKHTHGDSPSSPLNGDEPSPSTLSSSQVTSEARKTRRTRQVEGTSDSLATLVPSSSPEQPLLSLPDHTSLTVTSDSPMKTPRIKRSSIGVTSRRSTRKTQPPAEPTTASLLVHPSPTKGANSSFPLSPLRAKSTGKALKHARSPPPSNGLNKRRRTVYHNDESIVPTSHSDEREMKLPASAKRKPNGVVRTYLQSSSGYSTPLSTVPSDMCDSLMEDTNDGWNTQASASRVEDLLGMPIVSETPLPGFTDFMVDNILPSLRCASTPPTSSPPPTASSPVALDAQTRTAQMIANIRAKAYAAAQLSDDGLQRGNAPRELSSDSSDEELNPFASPLKTAKGKGKALSSSPVSRRKKSRR